MPKEYRTIREVAGPLMMISDVENVKFNELGEIELQNGERRRCKVLEIDGGNALVQLFENAAGINPVSYTHLNAGTTCCRSGWSLPAGGRMRCWPTPAMVSCVT